MGGQDAEPGKRSAASPGDRGTLGLLIEKPHTHTHTEPDPLS